MYGGTLYGALVLGAGLIVTSLVPVPPAATESNGYGTAQYGTHVYGAGSIVTAQTPVPPTPSTPTESNGYGTAQYGAHVYGAGAIVTSLVPVGPTTPEPPVIVEGGAGMQVSARGWQERKVEAATRDLRLEDEKVIMLVIKKFLEVY